MLTDEDITVVRRSLELKQLSEVPSDIIYNEWRTVFREFYLERLLQVSFFSVKINNSFRLVMTVCRIIQVINKALQRTPI
jgi:hypothetical protein